MNKFKKISFFFSILLIASACTGIYEDGSEIAKDKQSSIPEITVDELNAKIKNNENFLLIDVRQPNETWGRKIEGAVVIPRGMLEFNINNEDFWLSEYMYPPSKDSTEIIVYCEDGERGILSVEKLLQLGYKNVKNLKGGYKAFNPNADETTAKPPSGGSSCGG